MWAAEIEEGIPQYISFVGDKGVINSAMFAACSILGVGVKVKLTMPPAEQNVHFITTFNVLAQHLAD